MQTRELQGGCLCGATRYRVSGAVDNLCCCHCRSCRLASGAPFVAWGTFENAHFSLTGVPLAERKSSEKVVRGFCGSCGTSLIHVHAGRQGQHAAESATLDEPETLAPETHI